MNSVSDRDHSARTLDHSSVPYAESVASLADLTTARLLVPGHGGTAAVSSALVRTLGEKTVRNDFTGMLWGIDRLEQDGLERARELAADAWGARRTWFLTNGASQGNRMALIAAAARAGGEAVIVAQRSAHSSFVDGLVVTGLTPHFVTPTIDDELSIAHGVHADDVEMVLSQHPDAKAVYVISPSYFGAVSDIPAIADVAHRHGVPLVVDGAWGAHFGFHPDLPENPIRQGADVVVSSTHKMGGSLHQSAMLHLAPGDFADELEPLLDRAHRTTQSTSTSSILLVSLDIARRELVLRADRIEAALGTARRLGDSLESAGFPIASRTFSTLRGVVRNDPLNLTIDVRATGMDGNAVRERLALGHGILTEMSTTSTVVALIPPGTDLDGGDVVDALRGLREDGGESILGTVTAGLPVPGPMRLSPREAYFAPSEVVSAVDAVGRISAESLAAYPPGIPNVMPGEVITEETVAFLQAVATSAGGYVRGAIDPRIELFRVVATSH